MGASLANIQYYFDLPVSWDQLPQCLCVRGWCFASNERRIQGIRLCSGERNFPGVVGKVRSDVKAARPDAPDDDTGFELRCTLLAGRQNLCIEVQLDDGSWHSLLSRPVTVRRRWRPLWLGGGNWTDLLFSQFSCHMRHPPRVLALEKFPAASSNQSRWPKFSIVTPSLQQARFLGETMRSVLEQHGPVCEYVVQDGGSTDGSKALIERVAAEAQGSENREQGAGTIEKGNTPPPPLSPLSPQPSTLNPRLSISLRPRLLQWSSEPDHGQADAIVRGFAKTSGGPDDLMAWINSDDFYLPGSFAFVADFFARHPEVDVVYGHRLLVDEASREIGRWFLPKHQSEVLRLYDFVPQETLFWRRRIWDRVGAVNSSYKFAMDWDLLLRFEATGARIVRVPYFLACFRLHAAQKTSAQIATVGQQEIDGLRARTFGREIPPAEIESDSGLLRYLRRSAWIELLWKFGIRAR